MERWAAGDIYERFMGRWSREIAARFIDWLQPAPRTAWLDVGCGTGALTGTVARARHESWGIGLDPSLDFVRYARQQTTPAQFVVANAVALPIATAALDAVFSGLALNFFTHPPHAVAEMVRVTKPGGVVAAYVWDYAGEMEFLRYFWDAAVKLDASAAAWHEGQRFPICRPEALRHTWQDAGLLDVEVTPLEIVTRFENFDDYWQPFTVGNFPAPQYAMSLDAAQRTRLYHALHAAIPIQADGTLQLIARAWAVRGRRAG